MTSVHQPCTNSPASRWRPSVSEGGTVIRSIWWGLSLPRPASQKEGKKWFTLLAKPSQTWHSQEQCGYYSRSKSCRFIAHWRPHSPKQLGLFYDSPCSELIHNQHFLARHIYKDLISLMSIVWKKLKKTFDSLTHAQAVMWHLGRVLNRAWTALDSWNRYHYLKSWFSEWRSYNTKLYVYTN